MHALEVTFQVVISKIFFIFDPGSLVKKISFETFLFGVDIQPRCWFLISINASMLVSKHQLPLNSPNHFSRTARPKNADTLLGFPRSLPEEFDLWMAFSWES